MNPMTFTSQSPVWLLRYLWLEIEIKIMRFPNGFHNTIQSIGENEYGKTDHSKIFTFWGTSWSFWSAFF